MSAVTTMRGTACYWTTGSLACASRAFPFPSCATGSVWLSCPLTGSWPQPSCAGEAGNGVPSAGRPLSPNPNRGKYCPDCAGRMKKIKAAERKAETKAEMSRFRAFQTRINQGFFRGCQRVRDTFILFPRKRRFNA